MFFIYILYINSVSKFIYFYYHLIVHQKSLNRNHCNLYKKLLIFNKLSSNNEII
jgi:hypothetical protein